MDIKVGMAGLLRFDDCAINVLVTGITANTPTITDNARVHYIELGETDKSDEDCVDTYMRSSYEMLAFFKERFTEVKDYRSVLTMLEHIRVRQPSMV